MIKKIIIINVCVFAAIFFLPVSANPPEKMDCIKTGKNNENTQCSYQVYGEDTTGPKTPSLLYFNSSMPYALCANAKCSIDKADPTMALCMCPVFGFGDYEDKWQKASVGPLPYEQARPTVVNGKAVTVTSAYSSANLVSFSNTNLTRCSSDSPAPWANCFGAGCDVSADGKTATCHCPVIKTSVFVSVGPSDIFQCQLPSGKLWSAATPTQNENNEKIMKGFYQTNFYNTYQLR